MTTPSYGAELAAFVSNERRFPHVAERAARRAILDSVGVAVAGARHAASRIVARDETDRGVASLIGMGRMASVERAALTNGVMAHVLDFDDTLLPTRLHPSATLVPALLAVGEERDLPGSSLTGAFVIGFEIQAHLADVTYPAFAKAGWHGTGIFGGVGAAAAVSRLIGLDEVASRHALGIAATGAGGMIHVFGSMAKSLNLGRAAAIGVQSALLAESGFTSTDAAFGSGPSFLHLYDPEARVDELLDGLGRTWRVADDGFKPYPCGVVGHAAIDAVRELRSRAGSRTLRRLRVHVAPETMRLMGAMEPKNELEAKFSVRYCAAAAWRDGSVTPASFADDRVVEAGVDEIMARTEVTVDESMAQEAASADVDYADGDVDHEPISHARGTAQRPMTDAELTEKFRLLTVGHPDAQRLLETTLALEATSIRNLAGLLRRPTTFD